MCSLLSVHGCTYQNDDYEIEVREVDDEQAEQRAAQLRDEFSGSLADGMDISLWASEELIGDPVSIDVDHLGRVLVTVTERRRGAALDIRGLRDWMIESIIFETVEDRREFLHRELSPDRSDENEWLDNINNNGYRDWRDLTVAKESVFRLEDVTGNGHANTARLFIRDFHDEITDKAGAVLYHEGDVFVGVAPDMWRIRDSNGDGYGDSKESISHGYGVNIGFAGHGMSGLTLGPDGRIYWSIGDRGVSITDPDGKLWHYPRQGVIVRSEPDGSNFEVYARGFRNTHEFAFDKYGNLIAVDNDGDHAGEFERLIYVVDGSDSGWRVNWQFGKYNDPLNNDYKVLMDEEYYRPRFDGQAAHLLPPLSRYHSGPAGMTYNPGTALSEQWKDHFFVGSFVGSAARSAIHAFTLKPNGVSFELDRDEKILEGLLATGMDFGPDGALYFADWIEGWTLNQQGRIWTLDTSDEAGSEVRMETQRLLAENFSSRSSEELLNLLAHADMRVRQKAQFELAGRDDTETLQLAAEQTDHHLKRMHGIWGLAQIGRRITDAVDPLISLLDDPDTEVRAQAAKMLGDVRFEPAADALIALLNDQQERVQYFATEALGRMDWRPGLEPIVDMLATNDDEEIYLRHGGAIALERIGDTDAIADLSEHPSRAVRIAAVVALNRLDDPGVIRFLGDEDEFIVTNAARAINDDTLIEEGLEALAEMLEQDRFVNEPLLRRAINANLYSGTAEDARRLAKFSVRDDIPEALRVEALRTLSVWPESSRLDRVTGDPREKVENDPENARQAIAPVIAEILAGQQPELQIAGLELVSRLAYLPAITETVVLISEDPSSEVRMAALQALADMEYEDIEEAVFIALEDEDSGVRMNALLMIPELSLPEENMATLIEPVLDEGTVREQQSALRTLARINDTTAHKLLERQLELLISGELAPEVELELVQAAESRQVPSLHERLQTYNREKENGDSVSVYRESLYGGDAEAGRRIFYQDAAAQCIRCHVVDGEGSEVGPDLTHVADRLTRSELLEAMVHPNARVSPGYGFVTLTLENGETIRGVLAAESENGITITRAGEQVEVEKSEIVERITAPSGMPAMGELLTRSELRDLVEFLEILHSSGE